LKGEALFEVSKDPSHPFVINCGNATLKVLGTSFSLRASGDSIELSVLTGKVNISRNTDKTSIDVLPNEKVIYPLHGELEKVSLDAREVASIASGTEYRLQFNNVSLVDIARQLEKKFDTKISIESSRAGSCSATVDLTDQSLQHSLEMITEILDVEFRREGQVIIISGQGCSE
jgi:ferric-dicitrate binding protein FerR (iron transport regulator)